MKIESTYTNFQSKLNPVRPYIIKTKYGKLFVEEARNKDTKNRSFINNISYFFCNNFASMTKDPNWLIFRQKMSAMRDNFNFQSFTDYIKTRLNSKDNTLTLLLAKDKHKRIQGACLAYKYDDVPGAEEAYYIDSIAVNKAYRRQGIASSLLKQTINTAREICTDAFLTGDKMAAGFYKKMGFQELSPKDTEQSVVIDYISKQRFDYPQYVDLFNKPLKYEKDRWFVKSSQAIIKEQAYNK